MAQDNPSREAILARIRTALAKPAPPCELISHDVPLFPTVGELIERLQKELTVHRVDCMLTSDVTASAQSLRNVLSTIPDGDIFVQDAPDLREILEGRVATGLCPVGRPVRWLSEGTPSENSQATISLCELVVASTASIVVSSACGGRGASIIAPLHIVYAKTSQLVPDLDAAMKHITRTGLLQNSFIGFITGSSRTGDIEKILVHGAHGPRKLILILEQS